MHYHQDSDLIINVMVIFHWMEELRRHWYYVSGIGSYNAVRKASH